MGWGRKKICKIPMSTFSRTWFLHKEFVSGSLYSIRRCPRPYKGLKTSGWRSLGLKPNGHYHLIPVTLFCELLKFQQSQHTFNRFHQSNYILLWWGTWLKHVAHTGISYSMVNAFPNEDILVGGFHHCWQGSLSQKERSEGYPLDKYMNKKSKVSNDI